jgi:hypothetical protein
MATRYWLARSPKVAQVVTVTITGYDAATTYKITIGSTVVSVVGVTSANATATALQVALAASLAGEFREVLWTVSTATVTGTARTAGVPFTAASSVTGGGGTIGSVTTTVANSSPSDVNDANNWGGTLPTGTDSIIAENCDIPMLWNLDAFSAVAIASVIFRDTFTAAVGLPTTNETGSSSYTEYRPTELQFSTCTVLQQTEPAGATAAMRKFAVGANACTAQFIGAGSSPNIGNEVTWWRGTHANNAVSTQGASVAISPISSTTATVETMTAINGSTIRCGSGVGSMTTVSLTGSALDVQSNITTLTMLRGAAMKCRQTMTIGTCSLFGGTVIYNSNGTITTLTLGSQESPGTIDFSGDSRAVTITNLVNAYKGSRFNDPNARVTMSAGIKVPNGRLADITFDFGIGKTHTLS